MLPQQLATTAAREQHIPILPNNSLHNASSDDLIVSQNKVITLDHAIEQLESYETAITRQPFPIQKLQVKGDILVADDKIYELHAPAARHFYQTIGAPGAYLSHLPPPLRNMLLAHHLSAGAFQDQNLTSENSCIISRGGEFLDIGRIDLFRLRAPDVLRAVRDGVGADAESLEVNALRLKDETVTVELLSQNSPKKCGQAISFERV